MNKLTLTTLLLILLSLPSQAQLYKYGVVADPDGWTNVRSEADLESDVLGKVNSGHRVIIAQDKGDFWDCLLLTQPESAPETFGFIHKTRIKRLKDALGAGIVQDPDGWSNLRERPNSVGAVLQKLRPEDGFFVVVRKAPKPHDDWYLVETREGRKGYLHGSRIEWIIPRN